ncbi:DUF4136 domain-containing protein [Shewanella sp. D64]|uniref:DUF4136 domain-containing protein n=1 Tax=unclassified Shewanella TaxID=196818 RepID=UPI0022BA1C52|nr:MULTISPECIES: DUF4136 domain-containing protein [unclassified Shewanella]MEC4728245.1 DUF4136 domain-containing protein [Shewanella sp. D64]MEC4739301.1 DUF4136 domain-containing protein [Shewanella sp. E94]WBJ97039.1 DUF4136 domain-containing protein [Shewanella sp. MTB7]
MKNVQLILAVLSLSALSACSSMRSSSDYDPAINFSDIKTFAWVEQKSQDNSYHLDGLMDQRVRAAVDKQLALKGLKLTNAETADVLVNYLTKVDKKINVDTFNTNYGYNPYGYGYNPYGYGYGWGMSRSMNTQTTVREYEVGTLILDMIDRESGRLIWRGTVTDTIRNENTPGERVGIVNEAVSSMLMDYPPKPTAK